MKIFFTGGAGKAGRHVVPYLIGAGHRVTNADLQPLDADGVENLQDRPDRCRRRSARRSGCAPEFDELDGEQLCRLRRRGPFRRGAADPAGAGQRSTFRINTLSTYNVIEAALAHGIRKIDLRRRPRRPTASALPRARVKPLYVPVDEEHPTVPQDSYAMSKVVNEATARSFQARSGADIYGLRINNVIEPHEYAKNFPDVHGRSRASAGATSSPISTPATLGQMVERCLATDGLGYEVFNVSNDDMSVELTSDEVIANYYAGVEVRREMGANETFYSNEKAKRMLGFAPQHMPGATCSAEIGRFAITRLACRVTLGETGSAGPAGGRRSLGVGPGAGCHGVGDDKC